MIIYGLCVFRLYVYQKWVQKALEAKEKLAAEQSVETAEVGDNEGREDEGEEEEEVENEVENEVETGGDEVVKEEDESHEDDFADLDGKQLVRKLLKRSKCNNIEVAVSHETVVWEK